MKLLLDANLSRKLIPQLIDLFPNSTHVTNEGLGTATDTEVWQFALERGYVIVSKDEDFHQRALVDGPPPKVIWVRLGNCTTSDVEVALRGGHRALEEFAQSEVESFFVLGAGV